MHRFIPHIYEVVILLVEFKLKMQLIWITERIFSYAQYLTGDSSPVR